MPRRGLGVLRLRTRDRLRTGWSRPGEGGPHPCEIVLAVGSAQPAPSVGVQVGWADHDQPHVMLRQQPLAKLVIAPPLVSAWDAADCWARIHERDWLVVLA